MNIIFPAICLAVIVEICWTLGSLLRAIIEGEPRKSVLPGFFFLLGMVAVAVLHNAYQ